MERKFFLSLVFMLVSILTYSQTALQGKVFDKATSEGLPFATLQITKNNVFISGISTDLDGNYKVNLDPGTYDIEVSYVGYTTKQLNEVRVLDGKANVVDVPLSEAGEVLEEIEVVEYVVPLVENDNTTQGQTITSKEIRQLPTRNINALASTTAGLSSIDEGGTVTVRGSRSNATNYYVDGIRVFGQLPPESEIDQLQVITGGIGAEYGDVTGGIISITSKGPSNRFSGGIDTETSGFMVGDNYVGLDEFGQSLVGLSLSGPILRNKKGQSILGYRFSGRYTYQLEPNPLSRPLATARDEVREEIWANPTRRTSAATNSLQPTAEDLRDSDVEYVTRRDNNARRNINLTAKIDARLTDDIDITFTGSLIRNENQFYPSRGWLLLNGQNNPTSINNTYRGIFRFRQRFPSAPVEEGGKPSVIQNLEYTLSGGYELRTSQVEDPRHQDNFFDYGYIGRFDIQQIPTVNTIFDSTFVNNDSLPPGFIQFLDTVNNDIGYIGHVDYADILTGYTPGNANPGLAAYNDPLLEGNELLTEVEQYPAFNGGVFDDLTNIWGFHTNANQVYNLYQKTEREIYTANVRISFDLLPGGSEKGRHAVALGFLYESRINRSYSLNPRALWILGRRIQNNEILGVDFENQTGQILTPDDGFFINTTFFDDFELNSPQFDNSGLAGVPQNDLVIQPNTFDALFYNRIREELGLAQNDFVNIDALTPDQLSLDMFAPKEVTDFVQPGGGSIIDFVGYDYLGNKVDNDVTFDDFFSQTEIIGQDTVRRLLVEPTRPIYMAGYIQDKFTFKDIIFRLGVRVDRYDANRRVLRDILSLYEIIGADDFYNTVLPGGERPANIGDDYKVYTDAPGSTVVKAFRDGEQWYFADGTAANDPISIFGQAGLVTPYYQEQGNPQRRNIKSLQYDPNTSFEDYEVQWNVMPRLAFSFPISDFANFFAHYDILVQRPTSNTTTTALDYFYFTDQGRTPANNPNLLPQKTIDYEVGFQQKLSNSSAIKIAAYYREMRDMIQLRQINFTPSDQVANYQTFGNVDFGTVKGFTFQYDLRRTNNVQITANYTLQFAEGTGSNPTTSARALQQLGNLRTLFPLDFDERHRLNLVIDYRYGSGKRYNGPRLFGTDIFANAGVNLQTIFVSGRPYTKTSLPLQLGGAEIVGTFNGARLPWNNTVNLRVDKNFRLSKPGAKRRVGLNVYFRVQNLLDTENVIGVYTATGSPEDSGYLDSPLGQDLLEDFERGGQNTQAFLDAYSWALIQPGFFTLPRRMYIGAILDF